MPARARTGLVPVLAIALLASACAQPGTASPPVPTAARPAPTAAPATASPAPATAAPTAAPAAVGDPGRGKTVFTQTCSSCHGADARGLPGVGKNLTNNAFIKGQSDSDLVAFIKKGRPASDPANTTKVDMPPRGGNPAITDAQLADVAAYLRTLQD